MRKYIEGMFLVMAIIWAAMWTKIEDPPMGILGVFVGLFVALAMLVRKDK